jgi:hypothetical protein
MKNIIYIKGEPPHITHLFGNEGIHNKRIPDMIIIAFKGGRF